MHFLVTGLILLAVASFLMIYNARYGPIIGLANEGFRGGEAVGGRTGGQAYGVNLGGFQDMQCAASEMFSAELGRCVPAGAPGTAPNTDHVAEGFASFFMGEQMSGSGSASLKEGFSEAGGYGSKYEAMGPFDAVKLKPTNGVSSYRSAPPNEPLMGPAFEVGPDNLFMFKNNQCKPECCGASYACDGGCVCSTPEQRKLVNMRGGNRTVEDGF